MDKATIGASKALNESLSKYAPERKQHPFTEDARYKAKNLTEANGDGIKTLYDGSKWLVQTPTTEKGAEKLAEGTKWLNNSYGSYYDFEDYGKDLCVLTNKTNPQEKYYYAPWFDEGTGEGGIEVLADINDKHIHDEVGFFMNDTELCSVPRIAKDLMVAFGFAPTDKGVEFGIMGDDVEYCLQSDTGGNLGLFLEPNYSEEALKVLPGIIERHIQENPTSIQGKTDEGISESVVAKAIAEVTIDNIRDCVWDDVVQTVAKDWRSYFRGLLGGNVSISRFNDRWGSVFNVEIPNSCLPAMLSWMMSSPTFDYRHIAQKMFEGARCALIDSLEACVKENNIKFDADKAIENAVAYQFKENKIDWNAVSGEIAKSTLKTEAIKRQHRRKITEAQTTNEGFKTFEFDAEWVADTISDDVDCGGIIIQNSEGRAIVRDEILGVISQDDFNARWGIDADGGNKIAEVITDCVFNDVAKRLQDAMACDLETTIRFASTSHPPTPPYQYFVKDGEVKVAYSDGKFLVKLSDGLADFIAHLSSQGTVEAFIHSMLGTFAHWKNNRHDYRYVIVDEIYDALQTERCRDEIDKALTGTVIIRKPTNEAIKRHHGAHINESRTHRRYTKEDYSARPLRPLRPELLQSIKNRYPNGTRVELIQMEDIQAPPIGTKGTVYYVDDMGDLGVKWDNGSTLNVIYGVDSVKRINESRIQKPYRRYMTESRRTYNRNYRRPIRR